MNYKQFAKEYLEDVGAYDKDGNYGGMLGDAIMKLVDALADEGHSGGSAYITNEAFYDLNNAYSSTGKYKDNRSKIWDKFWLSDEGKKLQEDVGTPGIMNKA